MKVTKARVLDAKTNLGLVYLGGNQVALKCRPVLQKSLLRQIKGANILYFPIGGGKYARNLYALLLFFLK